MLRTLASDVELTENGVQADLGTVPAAQAVAALVTAGVAVTSAAPRNRLEDVFLATDRRVRRRRVATDCADPAPSAGDGTVTAAP